MSSQVNTTTMTIQQQSAAATRELCQALGLGTLKPAELKLLTVALARVAADETRRNEDFGRRIRSLYQSLLPEKPAKKTTPKESANRIPRRSGKQKVELIPIGTVDESELNPYAPPNPWALQRLYGDPQLLLALGRYSPDKLKQTLPAMQQRYPGTKPKRLTKPGIIEYIVEMLTSNTAQSQPASVLRGQ